MGKRMINMGSIEQFRSIIRNVQHSAQYVRYDEETGENIMNRNAKLPIVLATGSEKIHGTNAAVCYTNSDGFWVQSRENIITVEKDNAACAFYAMQSKDSWMNIINILVDQYNIDLDKNIISVYYEWCGGNIQKNSAASGLNKFPVIFRHFKISPIEQVLDVNGKQINATWHETCVDNEWICDVQNNIFNIMNFPTWDIEIDFENPAFAQNEMLKIVTEEIEPVSPFGKVFDQTNIGEGMVVTFLYNGVLHKFKVKGEKHSNSKVKTLKPVDTVKEQKKIDFANYAASSVRLEQAWQTIFGIDNEKMEPSNKATGDFIRAVIKDVWKEESDVAAEKGLEPKEVNSSISKISSRWFMDQLDKLSGL